MILFFGTRPGKTEQRPMRHAPCPHCGQTGTLMLSRHSNYFHLFWIKLFKISKKSAAECSHCKRVYFQEEFSEAMLRELGH
ncbi:zinc-ribbon domain-containing protein [Maribacter sp. 2307ULW6-5]|uniref:zinc-ribbon domain-containing protein n=1 Tax=Maribacter sp. 2307ULW6-5 TaxID=3386275 RepID=UPI0039BD6C05